MILSIQKEFIHAFIEELGIAHGGKTGDELYKSVFEKRKEELQRLWTDFCKSSASIQERVTEESKRKNIYRTFIYCKSLADNE